MSTGNDYFDGVCCHVSWYRYAFGIIICSLALVTIILALVGIIMGMAGFRKNKDPDQRTKLSHCGGIFLLM